MARAPGATSVAAMSDQASEPAPERRRGLTPGPRPRGALDGPAARIAALGVFLLCAAALAWIHRDDLFPPDEAALARDDPVALCLAGRVADIERMRADGVIDVQRAELFTARAEALCQAQVGGGNPPPPPR